MYYPTLSEKPNTALEPTLSKAICKSQSLTAAREQAETELETANQALLETREESDKADMDVESFYDGYLAVILVEAGQEAPVGEAIAYIAETEAEIELAKAGRNVSQFKVVSSTKDCRNFLTVLLNTSTALRTQYAPVPYSFEFSLSIYVRNTEDGTQILEQILPEIISGF